MRVWVGEISTARPPQGGERIAGNSWLCNIRPEFRYGKPRIDFLLELKRYTLRVNGVGCFPDKSIERSAVLTGTGSGQRRLGSYGGPLRSRNDHKVVAQCGSLSGLWRGSGWCRSSREELCCAGMDMWIRGRVKQKAAPKDPFRIAADRISFGNVAAIYQCFKMGKF